MTGYLTGTLADPDGVDDLLATAAVPRRRRPARTAPASTSTAPAWTPGPPRAPRHGHPAMWLTAADTLRRLADLGERPTASSPWKTSTSPSTTPAPPSPGPPTPWRWSSAVDSPHLRMNLDLYHAQIGEGNLIELCDRALPYIGEIQVADVPGRCEPGTGEINYPAIATALDDLGYTGVVALEGWARDDSDAALDAFRSAFTP